MVRSQKDHPETAGEQAKADPSTAEVQRQVDEENEQGFRGVEVDPTPNENYTVAGVTSGAPTPETDDEAAEQARTAQADAATRAAGVSGR